MNPVYIGRFTRGTLYATIYQQLVILSKKDEAFALVRTIKAPLNIPADPNPAIARPRIKAIEFGAIPHIKLPSSKIPIAVR